MAKVSRRGFFKQTSASVATFGALAAVPILTAEPEAANVAATDLSAVTLSGPLIAHVSDFASGEISLLIGTQEIIYRDPQLVMRLLQAIR